MTEAIAVILIGIAAGAFSGMLGVGGGILFVPALALIPQLSHIDAEATSLLAIIPVSLLGAYRQRSYGNVRVREGLLIGALALAGVAAGVVIANAVPQRGLEIAFAVLILVVAAQFARRGLTRSPA